MAEIEETRAIVSADETYEGKLIPTRRAEIERPVTIHENATVLGGIYGQDITIGVGATIEGPIMAQESVEFTGGTVTADVGTGGKVTGKRGTILGTIVGTKVTLTDCVVCGNVVGQDVILDDCLVLGVVDGERTLELRETLCYTFKSHGESVLDRTEIVLPQAIVDGPVTLETPIAVLALPDELLDEQRDGEANLTRRDLAEYDETQYLTLAPRLLNLSAMRDQIESIEEVFTEIVVTLKTAETGNRPDYEKQWFREKLAHRTE